MKKNVLFLIDQFSFGGGIEKVLSDLSSNWPEEEFNHYIVTCYDARTLSSTRKMIEWDHNAKEVFDLGYSFHSNIVKYARNYFFGTKKLKKLKKKLKIDISISIGYFSNEVNVASKRRDKVILTIHEQKTNNKENQFRFRKFKKADKVIGVSKGVTKSMEVFKIPKERLVTLYNPFDLEKIRNAKANNFCNKEDFNIINIGRFERQKGQWLLIDVMKEVVKEVPNAKLHIFGEGSLQSKLAQKVISDKLVDNIVIHNFKSNIIEYLKSCDLFLSTSLFEGFPLVMIESLASNVPVVASNFKFGASEILNPDYYEYDETLEFEEFKTGFVTKSVGYDLMEMENVDKKTITLLAQAVIKSYNKEYIKNDMKEVVEYLSLDKCISSWINTINEMEKS